jgi:signal transduction histidine kinase
MTTGLKHDDPFARLGERASLLYELGCAFAERIELDELIPLVMAKCREVLDAEGAAVLLLDAARNELYFPYAADEDASAAAQLRQLRFPADRGIAGAVLRSGQSIRVDDAANDPRFYGGVDRRTQLTTRALLSVPLTCRQGIIGVMQVLNPRTGAGFTDEDLAFLEALSGSVAVAIENARLYAELKAAAAVLEQRVIERTSELRDKNAELERTLAQLQQTQQQLVVQEKLASLGALAAGIAHEIKNPLNFVTNFAKLSAELADELSGILRGEQERLSEAARADVAELLETLVQNVEKIAEHGARADSIVRGMLQHSRGTAGAPEPTNVNTLLAEYITLAHHGMRAQDPSFNVTIETAYDGTVGTIEAVPQDLSRVFLNIINNACYATQEKRRRHGDGFAPRLTVRTKNLGDHVEIRIRDNGPGIAPAVREKLFTPFFTTKPPGAGTGLGLSISHDIVVQQHGGKIHVDTEEGSHTEFIIVLPRRKVT